MADRISVIGIGNTLMGDDGAGVRVAGALRGRFDDPRVTLVTGHTAGMALMPHVLEADAVIFIDALSAEADPGAIFRFDPDIAGVTKTRSETSHAVGIPYLITSARLAGHQPTFIVYAVQIGDTMCGPDTLTPGVEAAVPRIADMVAEEVAGLLGNHS